MFRASVLLGRLDTKGIQGKKGEQMRKHLIAVLNRIVDYPLLTKLENVVMDRILPKVKVAPEAKPTEETINVA